MPLNFEPFIVNYLYFIRIINRIPAYKMCFSLFRENLLFNYLYNLLNRYYPQKVPIVKTNYYTLKCYSYHS